MTKQAIELRRKMDKDKKNFPLGAECLECGEIDAPECKKCDEREEFVLAQLEFQHEIIPFLGHCQRRWK